MFVRTNKIKRRYFWQMSCLYYMGCERDSITELTIDYHVFPPTQEVSRIMSCLYYSHYLWRYIQIWIMDTDIKSKYDFALLKI